MAGSSGASATSTTSSPTSCARGLEYEGFLRAAASGPHALRSPPRWRWFREPECRCWGSPTHPRFPAPPDRAWYRRGTPRPPCSRCRPRQTRQTTRHLPQPEAPGAIRWRGATVRAVAREPSPPPSWTGICSSSSWTGICVSSRGSGSPPAKSVGSRRSFSA